ncbi:Bax inhibitor-1/YccA family protein [Hyphococcus luteus]|uniref:BAX inhibitor (BI)-1/YccA family protein n=1 Tax=Hyphococcus luteus TaxID=2058213 RepID=A0A2S7K5P9_9PROT|nr:Bax inhibitor-1/YccA family protein [Marinicaulis flavus]PQA87801.1 BAX inhibitor (BI)-1/YccA family protein [Marinicaulis flavus]
MNEPRRQFGAIPRAGGVAIDEGLRQYMLGVYNYMALGVAATGLFSMLIASNVGLMRTIMSGPLMLIGFFGILGMGMMAPKVIMNGSKVAAHAMFWAYAALWGVMIAPMLYMFQQQGAAVEIYRAFFITASIFGALSLWGYTTKKDISGWAPILGAGLIGVIVVMLLNYFFFQSTMGSLLTSCAVVVLVSAMTAYETQMIKSLYREGSSMNERTAIFGAFALYGSFVTLFIHILNILGIMRD